MANLGAPYKKKDSTAAIGPLGLLGFGLTTFLLNLGNAGVFDMAPPVLAMGICYGGLAQLIAGIMEWKKGNNFTSVAFISFATFWWSFVSIHAMPSLKWLDAEGYAASLHTSMGWYLILWFVFTFIMLIAFSAIYSGAAEIINGAWTITILPLGAPGEK